MNYSRDEINTMQEICNNYHNQYSSEFEIAYDYIRELQHWMNVLGVDYKARQEGNCCVYMAFDGDKPVYVGSGKVDRYKHVTSGISHNKELNRLHFAGINLYVTDFGYNMSESEALRIEKLLIQLINPTANDKCKVQNSFVRNYGSLLDAWKHEAINTEKLLAML